MEKVIDFRGSKDAHQHHLIIDINMNVVVEILHRIGTLLLIVSFIAAIIGTVSPFFYKENFMNMSKNEIFWMVLTPVVSVGYIYLVVRYFRQFIYIIINQCGEKTYHKSPIKK